MLFGVGLPLSVFLIAQHVPRAFISSGIMTFIWASISSEDSKLERWSVGKAPFCGMVMGCDVFGPSSAKVTRTSGVDSGLLSTAFKPFLIGIGCVEWI